MKIPLGIALAWDNFSLDYWFIAIELNNSKYPLNSERYVSYNAVLLNRTRGICWLKRKVLIFTKIAHRKSSEIIMYGSNLGITPQMKRFETVYLASGTNWILVRTFAVFRISKCLNSYSISLLRWPTGVFDCLWCHLHRYSRHEMHQRHANHWAVYARVLLV